MIVILPYPENHPVLLNVLNYKAIIVNENHIVHHVENFILLCLRNPQSNFKNL